MCQATIDILLARSQLNDVLWFQAKFLVAVLYSYFMIWFFVKLRSVLTAEALSQVALYQLQSHV